MKRLLITGFMPFGGEETNPSWEAVCRLSDEIGGYSLTKLLVPVVFGKATDTVVDMAQRICPDVIISVGLAGGRSAVTPELVAINLRYAKALAAAHTLLKADTLHQSHKLLGLGELLY